MKKVATLDPQSYINLLPRIIFQTPPTRFSGGPNYYKFTKEIGGKPVGVRQTDFYAPHFKEFPRERCAFFRNSLRVSSED